MSRGAHESMRQYTGLSRTLFATALLLILCCTTYSSAFTSPCSASKRQHVERNHEARATHPISRKIKIIGRRDCAARETSALGSGLSASAIALSVASFYKASPVLANFVTCSLKAGMADRLAQWRDVCTTEFSYKRNMAMMLYSGTMLGMICTLMYNRVMPIMFGTEQTIARAVKMTFFDAFINAPLLWLPPVYLVQALVYRYPKRKALRKYVNDVKENGLLTKYWSLWLPVTFLNFSIVPPHFRIAFAATVSFFWMILLSLIANNQQDPESCPLEPEPVLLNPRALD